MVGQLGFRESDYGTAHRAFDCGAVETFVTRHPLATFATRYFYDCHKSFTSSKDRSNLGGVKSVALKTDCCPRLGGQQQANVADFILGSLSWRTGRFFSQSSRLSFSRGSLPKCPANRHHPCRGAALFQSAVSSGHSSASQWAHDPGHRQSQRPRPSHRRNRCHV